jgi:hypothetical protein
MIECKHGLDPDYCSICRDPQLVYVSGGGEVFHMRRDCPSLESGQQNVLDRGGTLADVNTMTRSNAEADGRPPCRTCGST